MPISRRSRLLRLIYRLAHHHIRAQFRTLIHLDYQRISSRITACGSIFGQASNILGRRGLSIFAIVAFAVGSVICATATSTEQLIAGRTIQEIGGAGCVVMPEILIYDLVNLRERGTYVGILTACWGSGTLAAPIIGGAFSEKA